MKKKRKATRIVSGLLATVMMLSMIVGLAGCSMFDKQKDESKDPTPSATVNAEVTNAPTDIPSDVQGDNETDTNQTDSNIPADQDEIDKAREESEKPTATPEPTLEPTTTPTPEVMPTLGELIVANQSLNLGENYKMAITFACDMVYEESGLSAKIKMDMDATMLAYGGSTYTDTYLLMDYLGMSEEENIKEYAIVDKNTMTMTEYSYDVEDDTWYKSTSTYIDLSDSDEFIDIDDIELGDFSNIEVTSDDNYYYAVADAIPGSDMEGSEIIDGFGFGDVDAETVYTFKFDRITKEFVSLEVVCKMSSALSQEELEEQNITSVTMEDLVILFEKNNTPIVVPDDIVKNAVEEEDDTWDNDIYTPAEPNVDTEKAIHEGWSSYFNSYSSETGVFKMSLDDNYNEIDVTLYGKENWYYDNQWSFGTYLAVRDDKLCKDGPAYEVLYEDSDVKVNTESTERAVVDLLKKDYEEKYTSADIIPVTVNGKQCFVFESYRSKYSRTISILQDVGFYTYVSIEIETEDLDTPTVSLAETFMLNFTYDGAQ